jgi:hypothetical protein
MGLSLQPWYEDLMRGLRDVARDGTGGGLQSRWRRGGLPGLVLAKTGTLSEPGEAGPRDDLYTKSLLVAVGEAADAPGQPVACGIVGGLYFRFREGPSRGSLESYQVTFAKERLGEYLREHWDDLGVCQNGGL